MVLSRLFGFEHMHPDALVFQRREFIKENKKVRKKKENTLLTQKPTKKKFRLKNMNKFNFQPLIMVSVICRFDQIEYI